MAGLIPKFASLRDQAREILSESCFHYFDGGAEDEITLIENRDAWKRFKLVPRVLCDVSTVDTTWKFLGREHTCPLLVLQGILDQEFKAPIIVAPMSMQCWAHEEGELATAKAAAKCGLPYVFPSQNLTFCTHFGMFRDCLCFHRKDCKRSMNWKKSQLYCLKCTSLSKSTSLTRSDFLFCFSNEDFVKKLIQEYYELGARCFIVTVDAPLMGNRERHTENM